MSYVSEIRDGNSKIKRLQELIDIPSTLIWDERGGVRGRKEIKTLTRAKLIHFQELLKSKSLLRPHCLISDTKSFDLPSAGLLSPATQCMLGRRSLTT